MRYDKQTPDDHTFIRVPHQTGCARCGYASGHHPTKQQHRTQTCSDAAMRVIVALDFNAGEEH